MPVFKALPFGRAFLYVCTFPNLIYFCNPEIFFEMAYCYLRFDFNCKTDKGVHIMKWYRERYP